MSRTTVPPERSSDAASTAAPTATPAPPGVRWTAYIAVAIVFAIACAFLSNWQFTRNASRSEQLALVEANYDARPVPIADLIPAASELSPEDRWRPVILTGAYLADEQLLVRNRPHGGTSAFEVLVPFRLDDGRVFLIDRGWVPPGADQPDPDDIPAPPSGAVTVVARLQAGEALPASGRSAQPGQVPTINLPLVASLLTAGIGEALDHSAYGVMVSEEPAPARRPETLPAPSEDPGPHLSYAIQWILFAVMGFVFIGYIIRTERRHRREDAAERASTGSVEGTASASRLRGTRRRDRDMTDEDALLDAIDHR